MRNSKENMLQVMRKVHECMSSGGSQIMQLMAMENLESIISIDEKIEIFRLLVSKKLINPSQLKLLFPLFSENEEMMIAVACLQLLQEDFDANFSCLFGLFSDQICVSFTKAFLKNQLILSDSKVFAITQRIMTDFSEKWKNMLEICDFPSFVVWIERIHPFSPSLSLEIIALILKSPRNNYRFSMNLVQSAILKKEIFNLEIKVIKLVILTINFDGIKSILEPLLSHPEKSSLLSLCLERAKKESRLPSMMEALCDCSRDSGISLDDIFLDVMVSKSSIPVDLMMALSKSRTFLASLAKFRNVTKFMIQKGVISSDLYGILLNESFKDFRNVDLVWCLIGKSPKTIRYFMEQMFDKSLGSKSFDDEKESKNLNLFEEYRSQSQTITEASTLHSLYQNSSLGKPPSISQAKPKDDAVAPNERQYVNFIKELCKTGSFLDFAVIFENHLCLPSASVTSYEDYCSVLPRKVEFAYDRFIFEKFTQSDVYFEYLELIACGDYDAFCHCFNIASSLMASLVGRWNRSEKGLKISTQRILDILNEIHVFPEPLNHCREAIDLLTPVDLSNVIFQLWKFMHMYPLVIGVSRQKRLETIGRDTFENEHVVAVRSIIVKKLGKETMGLFRKFLR